MFFYAIFSLVVVVEAEDVYVSSDLVNSLRTRSTFLLIKCLSSLVVNLAINLNRDANSWRFSFIYNFYLLCRYQRLDTVSVFK